MPAEREVLLDSKASVTTPRSLRLCMLLCGVLLFGNCFYEMFRLGKTIQDTFPKLIVAVACTYACGFRKKLYLAPEGIIRETRNWFTRNEDTLPWEQIRHVTLAFRRNDMLALFEKGTMGWKIPCNRQDEAALRAILKKHIPNVEIETLGR